MLLFAIAFLLFVKSSFSDESAGVELCVPISTFNSVSGVAISHFTKEFSTMSLPKIEEQVDSPAGKIDFIFSDLKFQSLDVQSAVFSIATSNTVLLKISHACGSLIGDWSYKVIGGSGSSAGTADLFVDSDVSITFGAKMDHTQTSGVQLVITDCTLSFHTLNGTVHGGPSWLQDWVMTTLKDKIEQTLESSITSKLQTSVLPKLQNKLDEYVLLPIDFHDVELSLVIETFEFDAKNDFLLLGVRGEFFEKTVKRFPGTPVPLPTSFTPSSLEMINAAFTQFSVNSLFWTLSQLDVLKYVILPEMIPSSFPFQLNTTSFRYIIPNLYNVYPDDKMQITITSNPSNPPLSSFTTDSGIITKGDIYLVFQVFNDSKTETPVEAFVIDVQIGFNSTPSFYLNKTTKKEMLTLSVDLYGSMTMTLVQSNIGQFSLAVFQLLLQPAMSSFVLPKMNQYLKEHPFQTPKKLDNIITFQNVNYQMFQGYAQLKTDFTLKQF